MSYLFIKTNFIGIRPQFIPPHDPRPGLIWNYGVQVLYNPILALVKASILVFLLRLFGQREITRRCIHTLSAINALQAVGVLAAVVFQCTPIAFAWGDREGTCLDRRALFTAMSALNILMDLLVLALPLWIFSGLRVPGRTKAALLVVFLLGFLVTITSVVRLALLVRGLFELPGVVAGGGWQDDGFGFVTSAIETNLALVTASAPALRPLLRGNKSRYRLADNAEMGMVHDKTTGDGGSSSSSNNNTNKRKKNTDGGRKSGSKKGRRPVQLRDIRVIHQKESTMSSSPRRPNMSPPRSKETEPRGRRRPGTSDEETGTTKDNATMMRLSDVQREIDVLVKDLSVGPGGSFSLKRPTSYYHYEKDRERGEQDHHRERGQQLEREVRSWQRTAVAAAPRVAPPEASFLSGSGVASDASFAHRPRGDRDFSEERRSKYGDKRNGMTPREPAAPPDWPF